VHGDDDVTPQILDKRICRQIPKSPDHPSRVTMVLRISSADNKGGPPDINIAQILHLSNFFELKRRLYIHLQAWRTRKVLDIQLVYHSLQI
jgi:hypothetical protein